MTSIPTPVPGLVIRYSFLWSRERDDGKDNGAKDRPCAIVVALAKSDGEVRTVVVPITHTPPYDPITAIEVPPDVKQALGLDNDQQWVCLDEINVFVWPGYDLKQLPGKPGQYDYGMIPSDFFEKIRLGVKTLQKAKKTKLVAR